MAIEFRSGYNRFKSTVPAIYTEKVLAIQLRCSEKSAATKDYLYTSYLTVRSASRISGSYTGSVLRGRVHKEIITI